MTSLRTPHHGNTVRALDSIQNSDTAFSWVCTTAGKGRQRRRQSRIEIYLNKKYFMLLFLLCLFGARMTSKTHDASNHFSNLPLECIVGHRHGEKRPTDKEL